MTHETFPLPPELEAKLAALYMTGGSLTFESAIGNRVTVTVETPTLDELNGPRAVSTYHHAADCADNAASESGCDCTAADLTRIPF